MEKIIQEIDQILDDWEIKEIDRTWPEFEDMLKWETEIKDSEYEHNKKVMPKIREFIQEQFELDKNWCIDRNTEYLENEKERLRQENIELAASINGKTVGSIIAEYWFGDDRRKQINDNKRDIKKLDNRIQFYYNTDIRINKITDRDIEMARESEILQYMPEQGRNMGDKVFFKSPFREERTPSFCVYLKTNSYRDFGSSESGDVIKLVEKLNNMNFIESVKFILKKY